MDARTGKKIRMGRLFNQQSQRSIIVAYSHGVLMGPQPGMQTLAEMAANTHALRAADGIMITPGVTTSLEDAFIGRDRPSLVIHMDWQSFGRDVLAPRRDGTVTSLATVEDVAATGADALMSYLYLGQEDPHLERMEIERNAHLARACDRLGLVLIIEPRSAREKTQPEEETRPEVLATYCRIAAEIGADLIKCVWPGSAERFAPVAKTCLAPVLMAGGRHLDHARDALQLAYDAVQAGAAGLVFGRNIYQAENTERMLAALRSVVHEGGTPEAAAKLLRSASWQDQQDGVPHPR